MKLYSSFCIGLLVVFWCPGDDTPAAVSEFCKVSRAQLANFRLTNSEAAALRDVNVRKLSALRRKYRRLCRKDQPTGR